MAALLVKNNGEDLGNGQVDQPQVSGENRGATGHD
jgi:hypothetical protein